MKNIKKETETIVKCNTIDNFVSARKIDFIDFLKIDTQGHSYEILEGTKNTLEKNKVGLLQIEVIFSGFYKKRESLSKILRFLELRNYELYTIINGDSEQIGNFFYSFKDGSIRHLI